MKLKSIFKGTQLAQPPQGVNQHRRFQFNPLEPRVLSGIGFEDPRAQDPVFLGFLVLDLRVSVFVIGVYGFSMSGLAFRV